MQKWRIVQKWPRIYGQSSKVYETQNNRTFVYIDLKVKHQRDTAQFTRSLLIRKLLLKSAYKL